MTTKELLRELRRLDAEIRNDGMIPTIEEAIIRTEESLFEMESVKVNESI